MFSALTSKFKPSISLRLAALFCVFFSLSLILAFLFAYFEVAHSLVASDHEVISAKWRELATVYTQGGPAGLKTFLSEDENRGRNAEFLVSLVAEDGGALYLKPSAQDGKFDYRSAAKKLGDPAKFRGWFAIDALNDEDRLEFYAEKVSEGVSLQVGRSSEDREDVLEKISLWFFVTSAIMILLSAGFGLWYARRALFPIRALTGAIQRIETEGLAHRVPLPETQDELRVLAKTFNRLMVRIERLVLAMRDSVDNVAHDIRTPLTRMKIRSEEALLSQNRGAAFSALEECSEGISDISCLVSQVLDIAEAEAGVMKLRIADASLEPLLKEVIDVYEHVAEEKNISVHLACGANLVWPLDRRRIKQVVGNLLDNALKFSPGGSQIFISAAVGEEELKIFVADQGGGISSEDLPRIWDRLFRGDKSRSTSGLGLGLSLVRSIVEAHKGRATVKGNPQGGSTFEVSIPRAIWISQL